jgi:hypothetical protein
METFNVSDDAGLRSYNDFLARPDITIIESKDHTFTTTTTMEDSSTSETRVERWVEFDECTL